MDQAFSPSNDLAPPPTPSPSPVGSPYIIPATYRNTEKERQLVDGRGGRGCGRSQIIRRRGKPEAESKEKHGVWDPTPEMTITSPYVDSRVDSNIFTIDNPRRESTLTQCQSRLYPQVRDFVFGLWSFINHSILSGNNRPL